MCRPRVVAFLLPIVSVVQIAWAQAVEKTRAVADCAAAEALLSAIKPDAQPRRPHLVRWSPELRAS